MQWSGDDIAAADISGFANELIQMLMCSRVRSAVERKYDSFECKVGRDGQNGIDQMNLAGRFAHAQRLSHHLDDLFVSQMVKSSNADDVIEGLVLECESGAVHNHEPAIEARARRSDVVRVDVYSGISAGEAAGVSARVRLHGGDVVAASLD